MPRTSKGSKGVYVALPEDVLSAMKGLAATNGRTFRDEIISACRRHLATPPVLGGVEGPALPANVVPAGPGPKKGRPKGEKKGGK